MLGRLFRRARRRDPRPLGDPVPCWVRASFIPWRVPAALASASAEGCELRLSDRVEPGDCVLLEPDGFRPLPVKVAHVHERPGGPVEGGFDARVEFTRPLSDPELNALLGDR